MVTLPPWGSGLSAFFLWFIGCGHLCGLVISRNGFRVGSLGLSSVWVKGYHRLKLGSLLPWILRRCLPRLVVISCTLWSLVSSSLVIRLTGLFLTVLLVDWVSWKVYFAYHSLVRLRFKLASGLVEPWCTVGGISQGCPLSMVFIVALCVPWCRYLQSMPDVKPQLYADNLKCSAQCPNAFFGAAWFTA